jgi:hypothetical protein
MALLPRNVTRVRARGVHLLDMHAHVEISVVFAQQGVSRSEGGRDPPLAQLRHLLCS